MSNLRLFTEKLLRDPESAEQLRIADSYMRQTSELGRKFVLPREYVHLKPLVDTYSKDLDGFVEYVKSLRDQVPPRSGNYITLHELYRTILVRQVQYARRARINRALEWVKKHHPELNAEQRAKWARKVEQQWGRRRMRMMEEARRMTHNGRLNVAEREGMLEAFWKEIDKEIEKGKLPKP